jgi:hypothetical protein
MTVAVSDTTLNVTGPMTGGTVAGTNAHIDIAGQMTGGAILLNASTLMIGQGAGNTPSVTHGSIVYGTGVDAVFLDTITSGANALTLQNLYNNDSFAESNIAFDNVQLSGNVMMLMQGSTTVATFNVTLASGASTTFEPVTQQVINGKTYYVATLDPPAQAPNDPLTTPITPQNVGGKGGKFLQNAGTTTQNPLAQAGAPADLTSPDKGTQLTADLTNVGSTTGDPSQHSDAAVGSGHDVTTPTNGVGTLANPDLKPNYTDLTNQTQH